MQRVNPLRFFFWQKNMLPCFDVLVDMSLISICMCVHLYKFIFMVTHDMTVNFGPRSMIFFSSEKESSFFILGVMNTIVCCCKYQ